ncbi:MAG TPA: acetyl-CoA hydrolase/transferase C-terminal domain-containing protein [Syntrophomonadaceae bacterium]|nr:acetyl-CoA hydrolase/transferase C-terminal domain-containing protein [Syntrophomonadaceae bacterium]
MNYAEEYKKKLVSAEEAVKVVKSGDWIDYPLGVCGANELEAALARRKDELFDVKFRVILSVWPNYCIEADPTGTHFCWNSWHFSGKERSYSKQGLVYYIPMKFNELPSMVTNLKTDVFMATVAPMDKHGWFNFGASTTGSRASIGNARHVLVETNTNMPRVLGGNSEAIHISEVDYIYESTNPPLPSVDPVSASDEEKSIAGFIMERMRDGSCVQLGIGAMPGAVGSLVAASDVKDLGVHSEMYVDAFLEMTEAGKITGSRKNIDRFKQVFSFAFGSRHLYDFLDDNPGLASYPIDYVNNPWRIARNDNVVSVNAAIEVDLFGQVCSESVGTRHISGTGGQLDFVEGAYRSRGGQSFICLSSTFERPDGVIESTIKPVLTTGAITTCPRTASHIIVTEYGTADMKGRTTWERAEALVNIAHPSFRDDLIKAANQMKIWRTSNRL